MNLDVLYQSLQQPSDSGHYQPILLHGHPHSVLDVLVTKFARMLVCEGDSKPCGTCSQCIQYKQGAHPYVVDLITENSPGESYGLELAREFMRRLNFRATSLTPVVGIVRRLDGYTFQSLNALLKVFEEAPNHSYILLTAERTRGLPATVLSRVRRVRLREKGEESYTDSIAPHSPSLSRDPVALFKDKTKELLSHSSAGALPRADQQNAFTIVCTDIETSVRACLQAAAYTVAPEKTPMTAPLIRLMHSIAAAKKRLAQNANQALTLQSIIFHL